MTILVRFIPLLLLLLAAPMALADEATDILRAIHDRDRGDSVRWEVAIDLIDRNGNVRQRTGRIFRRTEGQRSEQVTVFLSPANIRHTALLDIDTDDGEDYLWLYLPALKATKRVPPAERGDKFVGTDFTMEDVDLGFEYRDYRGEILERLEEDGHPVAVMVIEPVSDELKRNLGYDRSIARVRLDQAIIVDQRFFKGERQIRHNRALEIRAIDGILTPLELHSDDLVNDHRTVMRVERASYDAGIPASYFRKEALAREMYR